MSRAKPYSKLTDFGKDVKEFDSWLVELENEAHYFS
jgi:hypothetical protein